MTGYSVNKKSVKYFYYKCTDPLCKSAINAKTLDAGVLGQIVEVFQNEGEIKNALNSHMQEMHNKKVATQPELKKLRGELTVAQVKEKQIADIFLSGVVTPENAPFWNGELSSARRIRQSLEHEIEKMTQAADFIPEEQYPALIEAGKAWAHQILSGTADHQTKRNLVMSALETIDCTKRTETEIRFRLKLVMSCSNEWWSISDSNR